MSHHFLRSLIYPWLIKGGKPTPVLLSSMAFVFCVLNGYLQARYLTKFAYYEKSWLSNPFFGCGIVLFFMGMAINIHSDHTLRNLRKPGERGYKIPKGRLFNFPQNMQLNVADEPFPFTNLSNKLLNFI